MRNRTQIIGLCTIGLIACIGLTTAFAKDAPPDHVAARAQLIIGSQNSIGITDGELKQLKAEKAEIERKIAEKEAVRKSAHDNMNADIKAAESEGWTWDFENRQFIPFEGSPKA